jgi:hypothetical protein
MLWLSSIACFAQFKGVFKQFDETREKAGELLTVMNENLFQCFPSSVHTLLGRMATWKMSVQSLHAAQSRGEFGLLHPMGQRIVIEKPGESGHRSTWAQCGALQAPRANAEDGVFSCVCRIDCLIANLM